ncbi:MAG TPA: type II toxin-antitoxin system HicB family antitoxin [Gemmataceae bacterium]|jgi:predicted RNase H-like HicB family nuclease
MHPELTAILEWDGDWCIGFCPEVPGANGQGRTPDECRASLAEAVKLILADRRPPRDGRPPRGGRRRPL